MKHTRVFPQNSAPLLFLAVTLPPCLKAEADAGGAVQSDLGLSWFRFRPPNKSTGAKEEVSPTSVFICLSSSPSVFCNDRYHETLMRALTTGTQAEAPKFVSSSWGLPPLWVSLQARVAFASFPLACSNALPFIPPWPWPRWSMNELRFLRAVKDFTTEADQWHLSYPLALCTAREVGLGTKADKPATPLQDWGSRQTPAG